MKKLFFLLVFYPLCAMQNDAIKQALTDLNLERYKVTQEEGRYQQQLSEAQQQVLHIRLLIGIRQQIENAPNNNTISHNSRNRLKQMGRLTKKSAELIMKIKILNQNLDETKQLQKEIDECISLIRTV